MQNAAYCSRPAWWRHRNVTKTLLVMKLTILLLTIALLHVQAAGLSQSITLSGKNLDMKQVFAAIKKQTGYVVFSKKGLLEEAKPVSLSVHDMPLADFLNLAMKDQPFTYIIADKTISLSRKVDPATPSGRPQASPGTEEILSPVPITGRILDAGGKPLEGTSVFVKKSKNSAVSHADGSFTLNVNEGDVLVITHVGYAAREIKITAAYLRNASFSISLQQSVSQLDQVQVIAYGTTTKRLNAGDVTTITAEDIAKNPVNNVFEAIQGKVPGLFIQQATGQPGGAFTLRLRGMTNFSPDNADYMPQPLIVVDGVIYPNGKLPLSANTYGGTSDFLKGGNGLNYLNPNDIESVSVLKDADATALYGSSGAYGVILITTKKAKVGAPAFNANIYTGISVLGQQAKLMNTQQYLAMRREALKNDGLAPTVFDKDINGAWPEDRYTDFRKELLGSHAQTTNVNLSYSGGTQNTSYLVSGSLRDNGNIQRHKGAFRDGSLRFSLNTNSSDNKIGFALSGTFLSSVSTMVPTDFSSSVVFAAPNGPDIFLPDGSVNWETGANDLADDINRMYRNVTNNLLANATLSYKPARGLTLRAIVGYSDLSGKESMGYPTTTKAPSNTSASQDSRGAMKHYDIRTVSVSPYAEYTTRLWKKGDLSLKAGGRLDNKLQYTDEISGIGFASDALISNPSAGTTVTSTFSETPYRSLGFHGVIKFVWDQKYIIDLNGRRDGSTKFGSGRKFGNFGSVAVGWIFSEEHLIKDHFSLLSHGKIRASTGIIGGDGVPDFAYLSTYVSSGGTYQSKTGLTTSTLANPLLSWEKNRNSEIGLELGFLHDRVYAEGNYYFNKASNQLISQSLPSITGFGSYSINSDAVIRTSGWEVSLNTINIKTSRFTWSTRFNISIPTSKLLKLPTYRVLSTSYIVGKPVTGALLYKYAGVNPATGNFNFTNAKGVTTDYSGGLADADKTEFLDLAPKYYGSFQNSFRYGQWSLDVAVIYTSRVGKSYLAQSGYLLGYVNLNGGAEWLSRWQKPGDITAMPKVSSNIFSGLPRHTYFKASTGAYSDASYARLQNLSLRYNFNAGFLQKIHVRDCAVYLQGQNLLTISPYGGLDPENLDAGTIPPMRTFTAGLNITF